MDRGTSEAYSTYEAGSADCLWFPEFDTPQPPALDLEALYDGDDDEDEGTRDYRPEIIDFRPSPVCLFAPRVRMLAERHRQDVSDLLNIHRGALEPKPWRALRPGVPVPPGAPPVQRIVWSNALSDPEDLEAVRVDVRAYWADLPPALDAMTGEEPREEFLRLEHHVRDWRFLAGLLGCKRELAAIEWWSQQFAAIDRHPSRAAFLRARDVMRKRDPQERELARLRDARRRGTNARREYQASYQPEYRQLVSSKAADAARKREARARQTPEQKEAEARRKRDARAAKKKALGDAE